MTNEQEVAAEREDFIHLDVFSDTLDTLQSLSSRHGWPEFNRWIDPERLLLLIERLKRTRDSEDVFPHGKWATIQRLQDIFEKEFWA